ncbi:hypothetical protein DL93DRAFT_1879469 [Clavulina sp. PMI_390]|nr:hypothetical protein DL93DRAFT_1879469 [Clavulina sp. PMI_390]
MGSAHSIPVIGEAVTAVEVAAKTVAAGACALVGKQKQADELMDGAKKSWVNYTEVNLIVGGLRVAADKAKGDTAEAERLEKKQGDAWNTIAKSTPGIGHVIGLYHYAIGDQKGGDEAMIEATKSAVIGVVGVATGGAGFVVAGAASAAAGLAYDMATTGITHEDQGFVKAVDHAKQTGSADDIFNAAEDPASAFLAEGLGKVKIGRSRFGELAGREGKSHLLSTFEPSLGGPDHEVEPEHPAEALNPEPPSNTGASSQLRDEIPPGHILAEQGGGRSNPAIAKYADRRSKVIPVEEIQTHPRMLENFVEHDNPAHAMQAMVPGSSYDFVRMNDGRVRLVDHSEAVEMAYILHPDAAETGTAVVTQASLVKESERHLVVSAGEASCGLENVLNGITPGAGRFQLPIQLMTRLISEYFPHGVLALDSPLYTRLLGWVVSKNAGKRITALYLYMTNLMVVATEDEDSVVPPSSESNDALLPLSSCNYFIVVKEPVGTKMLGFLSETAAKRAFDSLPFDLPAFLWCASDESLINARNSTALPQALSEYLVLSVNKVMPAGNWRQACKNGETWRDPGNSKYELRCTHTDASGHPVLHEMTFASAKSIVDFKDGRLVLVADIEAEDDD